MMASDLAKLYMEKVSFPFFVLGAQPASQVYSAHRVQKPEEGINTPGCELPGTGPRSSTRSLSTLNHQAIPSGPEQNLLFTFKILKEKQVCGSQDQTDLTLAIYYITFCKLFNFLKPVHISKMGSIIPITMWDCIED